MKTWSSLYHTWSTLHISEKQEAVMNTVAGLPSSAGPCQLCPNLQIPQKWLHTPHQMHQRDAIHERQHRNNPNALCETAASLHAHPHRHKSHCLSGHDCNDTHPSNAHVHVSLLWIARNKNMNACTLQALLCYPLVYFKVNLVALRIFACFDIMFWLMVQVNPEPDPNCVH